MSIDPKLQTAAVLSSTTAALLIAQQIASKSIRDGMFLSHFDVKYLPLLTIVAAALSIGIVIMSTRLMARYSPAAFVPMLLSASAVFYVLEWMLSDKMPALVAVIVYVHTVTFGAAVVSGFWSVINERFDPSSAKEVFATIGTGATFGGLIGGLVVSQSAAYLSAEMLLLALAAANLVCGILVASIARSDDSKKRGVEKSQDSASTLSTLKEVPFIRHIGAFVFLLALCTALIDYVFKAEAAARYSNTEELITFFALFYTGVGVVTMIVQHVFVRRSLVSFGLGPTGAFLPAAIGVFGLGFVFLPGFYAALIMRSAATSIENSLHRSAYELLFTPLRPAQKRATKFVIDVGADRIGTALGGGLALAIIAFGGADSHRWMVGVAVVGAIGLLRLLILLNRGYIKSLADSMRRGVIDVDFNGLVDRETAQQAMDRTLSSFSITTDAQTPTTSKALVRPEIRARRESRKKSELHARSAPIVKPSPSLREIVYVLRADDPVQVNQLLKTSITSHPVIISLLIEEINGVHSDVFIQTLKRAAPRIVGQLSDALLSPASTEIARGKIAQVLAATPIKRAVDALFEGLDDERFHVAHQCAIALLAISKVAPHLLPTERLVFDTVENELRRSTPNRRQSKMPIGFAHSPFYALGEGKAPLQAVHVFTILAFTLDPALLMIAFKSIGDADKNAHGTALEYMTNILPLRMRTLMTERFGAPDHKPDIPEREKIEAIRKFREKEISLGDLRTFFKSQ